MATPAEVLAALPTEQRSALTQRSDRAGLVHLAKHFGLIGALMIYVALGLPLWWAALLPLGIGLAFLFTLQHECTHQTPFKTPALNEGVGHLCAVILVQPFHWFRAFHMAHHRHTNDPDKDPELQGDAKPETVSDMAWHLSTLGYWAGKIHVLGANAMGHTDPSYTSARAAPRIKTEARVLIGVYVAVVLFSVLVSPILLWIWLVPILLGFPVLRLYLLAEHGRCPNVANMFLNSRTTLTNHVVKLLAWNMPYHAEHHAYPTIPFHKLPDAHRITKPHLGTLTDGYASFAKDYAASLK